MTFSIRLKEKAAQLKIDTLSVWYAARDPRTPWYARALAMLVAAYAFSPIDLVPDFIPVLGLLDDLLIIPAGIALVLKLVPPVVMADARVKAMGLEKKPVNWWAGSLVLLFWAALLFFAIRAFLPDGIK